jgi:hypothetical protein
LLPSVAPSPSGLPSSSQEPPPPSSTAPSVTPSVMTGGGSASAPGTAMASEAPTHTPSAASLAGASGDATDRPNASNLTITPRAGGDSNDAQPPFDAPLAVAGLVATAAVVGGLALAQLLGIGLGTLAGTFSAAAAVLDWRASRRARAVIGTIRGFGRRGGQELAPDGEDPILAAMDLRPLAVGERPAKPERTGSLGS